MKDPPKASSINIADNFTTIVFDLCNPMNMDTGSEILVSVETTGTSISGLRWKNRMQSKI
jgi:hypothetical protein